MAEMGVADVSLFSFHSASKGFIGECGHRGGYMEIRNVPGEVVDQIAKLQSISLCSNLPGQVVTYCMVNPPARGRAQPRPLRRRARPHHVRAPLAREASSPRASTASPASTARASRAPCTPSPASTLPAGKTDDEYCLDLLEATGLCVVPGSGFGQLPGTHHFRTTILPETAQIQEFVGEVGRIPLKL